MKVKRKKITWEEVEIEESVCLCAVCRGSGNERVIYGPPDMSEQYRVCNVCNGKGYLTAEKLKIQQELQKPHDPCFSEKTEWSGVI